MKFWRRHRHELQRSEADEPLPQPPDKKMRYSREDDILLAKYFHTKPAGTSDKVFQAFGRIASPGACIPNWSLICILSIHTTHGRAGRSITGYTKQRSITLYSCSRMEKILMGRRLGQRNNVAKGTCLARDPSESVTHSIQCFALPLRVMRSEDVTIR